MSNEDFSLEDLEYLDHQFVDAEVPETGASVPDGKYVARVQAARLDKTKKTNQPMLAWELVIVEGEMEGRHLFRNNVLSSEKNVGWLKSDLKKCGINIYDEEFRISEFLRSGTTALLDLILNVTVKNKPRDDGDGVNTNTYINGLSEEYEQPEWANLGEDAERVEDFDAAYEAQPEPQSARPEEKSKSAAAANAPAEQSSTPAKKKAPAPAAAGASASGNGRKSNVFAE